ncbi:MAG TPA: GGDEF domain-containing protein [Geomobilimonas sp.]|nr:GGDEF domain-containing protein [Geomobilimonas sp.]
MRHPLKNFTAFALPLIFLAVASIALPRIASFPAEWQVHLVSAPYLIFATLLLLSFHFNRGRVFCVALLLGIAYWSCRTYLQQGLVDFRAGMIYQSLAVLLPANITLFCFLRERGVLTTAGRLRLAFLAGQAFMVAWFVRYNYVEVQQFIGRELVTSQFLERFLLPQSALFLFLAGGLLIAGKLLVRPAPLESGMFGALLAVAVVCNWLATEHLVPLFMGTAGLLLIISVIQDSHNMAYRDDLTSLPSRRALNEQLMGLGRQYAIAMLDVDHFKKFNDTYGHDVGDQVLRMVASRMQGIKGGGRAFRYGGEEFTVLFPHKRAADAVPHLEEIRRNIADYQMKIRSADRPKDGQVGKTQRGAGNGDQTVSVTISIGVAECCDGSATPEAVIKAADQALYRAKHKGRNQVCT